MSRSDNMPGKRVAAGCAHGDNGPPVPRAHGLRRRGVGDNGPNGDLGSCLRGVRPWRGGHGPGPGNSVRVMPAGHRSEPHGMHGMRARNSG